MQYLCQVTEVYRCDSESEAKKLIEESKHNSYFELKKYNCEFKQRKKQKGEVIDTWYRVTLTKMLNEEKDPVNDIFLVYTDTPEEDSDEN